MRYFATSIICGVVAVPVAFVLFLMGAPVETRAYVRALPTVLPILSFFVFGALWFPTLLFLFGCERRRPSRSSSRESRLAILLFVVSGLAFFPSVSLLAAHMRHFPLHAI